MQTIKLTIIVKLTISAWIRGFFDVTDTEQSLRSDKMYSKADYNTLAG